MAISREEVKHIAELSMLNLSEEEIDKYTNNLQEIVEFANKINELNTDGVGESAFAIDSFNVFRKDEIKNSLDRDLLLSNAPTSNGEAYSLPSMRN
ncbi:MAG: Asp-tRNA(Asn)/Glu-tRNA(Gln) amidotransferase subunit GatC [Clostridia bacterium]|nr:Asp-tRNA(Asn)/Glu-tRNA(Gln) amidotransferase subunit GatC [Clostridia bacterium]